MIPETIKIGALVYTVRVIDRLVNDGRQFNGLIDYDQCEIHIDSELSEQARVLTFWHEVIHGILQHAGHRNHDEMHVEAVAAGLMQVLRDNEHLIH